MDVEENRTRRRRAEAKVLVVDPREADLERLDGALRGAGFKVVSLSHTDAAVPLFGVFQPHAVVIAADPPALNSLRVARKLRQLSRGTVPIFYLLEDASPSIRAHVLKRGHGLDAFDKPVDGAEIAAKLRMHLEFREAVDRAARAECEQAAPTLKDRLTETYNRPFLLAMLEHETRRCERHGGGFSLVACSLNGYAQFRREFGGDMAERLLVYTSVVLGQTVRDADVVARVGEDEFALLLTGTPAEQVPALLARLTARFEMARFEVEGRAVRTSISLGAVSFPDVTGRPAQILAAAFQELRKVRESQRAGGAARLLM